MAYTQINPATGKKFRLIGAPVVKKDAKALVTGDISHHQGIDAAANGLVVIDAGHYGLEHIFIAFMAEHCKNQIDGEAQIIQMPLRFPVQVW